MNISKDNPLLTMFPPKENTAFSQLTNLDLQELIILLKSYLLELRTNLYLDNSVTFGLELEFERANALTVYNHFLNLTTKDDWLFKEDMSIKKGGELVSGILKDTYDTWASLTEICNFLKRYSKACQNTGGHIHLGSHILKTKEAWLNFLKLWSVYENILFRFSYNEHLDARPAILAMAEPVANDFWQYSKDNNNTDLETIIYYLNSKKRGRAINFRNVSKEDNYTYKKRNTIEFRLPNGTLNPIIWQNNVNLFAKMLLYANNSSFDHDILDKRYEEVASVFTSLPLYKEIYLDQALEFCDLIFDNNLDKLNFLKQYLKNYKIARNNHSYSKTCSLTRRK